MMQGLYIGATGLKTHGDGMQIVSNNLANVSTVGYKQQLLLFQDLMYENLSLGTTETVTSQKGLGSVINDIRTLHTPGAFEPADSATDLSISGKGFFQVKAGDGSEYYTRAGNFRFDADGVLRDANGHAVTGIRMENGAEQGGLTEIRINFDDADTAQDPPKATTSLIASMNVHTPDDATADAANPYFSLLGAWDATLGTVPASGYSQSLSYFDAEGKQRELTILFDSAPAVSGSGQTTVEYLVTMPAGEDGRANALDAAGAGLLMAGTLTFSSGGELVNMSAFTPGGGDLKDLANWTPAALRNGTPLLTVTLDGQAPQTIAVNMGAAGAQDAWNNAPASAAAVGASAAGLPGLVSPSYNSTPTTALSTSSSLVNYQQNGYSTGQLNDLYVDAEGAITASYSNGQSHELFRIPIFRFTSEDGLRREGNNLYAATPASGAMQYGTANTENYGQVLSKQLETSNVDMAREMTSMIIVQRGFQSNSKSVTTLDAMIQRAIELKRN